MGVQAMPGILRVLSPVRSGEMPLTSQAGQHVGHMCCPECGGTIEVRHTRYPYFACPNCRCNLCVPRAFHIKVQIIGAVLGFILSYVAHVRGIALIACIIVAAVVIGAVLAPIGLVLLPPKLDRYNPSLPPGSLGLR